EDLALAQWLGEGCEIDGERRRPIVARDDGERRAACRQEPPVLGRLFDFESSAGVPVGRVLDVTAAEDPEHLLGERGTLAGKHAEDAEQRQRPQPFRGMSSGHCFSFSTHCWASAFFAFEEGRRSAASW